MRTSCPSAASARGSAPATSASPPVLENGATSETAKRMRRASAMGGLVDRRLFLRVVRAAHERAGLDVGETERHRPLAQGGKFLGRGVAHDGEGLAGGGPGRGHGGGGGGGGA